MNISATGGASDVAAGIQRMNDLLKAVTTESLALDGTMMKADVVQKVVGLGENVDVCA